MRQDTQTPQVETAANATQAGATQASSSGAPRQPSGGGPMPQAPAPAAPQVGQPVAEASATAAQVDVTGETGEAGETGRIDWDALAARNPAAAAAALKAWYETVGDGSAKAPSSGAVEPARAAPTAAPENAPAPETPAARRQRLAEAQASLARALPGWSPRMAAELTAYGLSRGFSGVELAAIEDPRQIVLLHLARAAEQAMAGRTQGRAGEGTAAAGDGAADGSGEWAKESSGNRASTDAWMEARHIELDKRRQAEGRFAAFPLRR